MLYSEDVAITKQSYKGFLLFRSSVWLLKMSLTQAIVHQKRKSCTTRKWEKKFRPHPSSKNNCPYLTLAQTIITNKISETRHFISLKYLVPMQCCHYKYLACEGIVSLSTLSVATIRFKHGNTFSCYQWHKMANQRLNAMNFLRIVAVVL